MTEIIILTMKIMEKGATIHEILYPGDGELPSGSNGDGTRGASEVS